jgi:phage head maturation protease
MKTNFNFQLLAKRTGTKREIDGYASTPDLDRDNDIIPSEVLSKAIDGYLEMGTLLYEHGHDPTYARKPIGLLHTAKMDEEGRLYVKGSVSDNWIWEKIELGELKAFSIGGMAEWEITEKDGVAIGIAKSMEIHEVSIVAIPANPNAIFSIAKSLQKSLQDAIQDNDKKVYNKDIIIKQSNFMEEMLKSIKDKIENLVSSDSEKVELKKSIEEKDTQITELNTTVEGLNTKVEELTKSLEETNKSKEALAEDIKALDKKLESYASLKKTAKTDEQIQKLSKNENIVEDADKIEKRAKELGLIL